MQKRWQKAKTGVGVARPTKMRMVRLRFAKTSIQPPGAYFHKSESWAMARPAKMGTSGCRWLGNE